MAVSLSKGANVSLSKEEPGLVRILVGLGWSPRPTDGDKFDLDASIFMLGENGKCPTDKHFIFYGNKTSPDAGKSVVHQGDNQTGEGEGDDEKIVIDLTKVPADIHKLVIGVTIHMFAERRQNFGMVDNSYVRIVNDETGREIAKYDLNEESALETAMLFGEVYRYNGEWKFKAIGQGFAGGLAKMAGNYGVDAG